MARINPEWLNRPHKRGNPEAHIQLQIIHYLKGKGYYIGKIKNKGSMIGKRFIRDIYQAQGLPDLICFTPTKMYFIEVKSATGQQSPDQTRFQQLCQQTNIPYILARKLEDMMEII